MIPLTTSVVRLVVALALGAMVGLERERNERAAGLRTHALVALGSALIMIVSAFGFGDTRGIPNAAYDPSRIAAQVVSGIGFIGAGTIILRRQLVRGLTTAAGIWLVAGIGLACGAGLLAEAAVTTGLSLIVLALLRPVEHRLFPHEGQHVLRLEVGPAGVESGLIGRIHEICVGTGAVVDRIEISPSKQGEAIQVRCHGADARRLAMALQPLRELPGVRAVRADLGGDARAASNERHAEDSGQRPGV